MEIGTRARLLVVHDDEIKRWGVARVLKAANYEVIEATTGADGLRLAQETMPDLILLDRQLPDTDGVEVCRQVKAGTRTSRLFVVFLSASQTSSDSQAAGLEGGADGYIAYPIGNRELLARVEAMLRIKRAEDRLRESEERLKEHDEFLRQVLDIIPHWIFVKNREGRFTLANRAQAEAFGMTVEELLGKDDYDLNPNREEAEQFTRDDRQAMDTLQEKFIPEEVTQDARGREYWLQTIKRPIVDKNGVANHVLGVATDITQRKRAEEALRYQASLIEQVSDAIVSTDTQFKIVSWNHGAEEMYGWRAEEALGKPFTEITRTDFLTISRDQALRELFEGGVWRGEVIQYHKNGGTINALVAASLLRDTRGNLVGAVMVNRDITTRVRAETQREAALEALQESEDKYKYVFDNSVVGKSITLPSGEIDVNKAFCEMLGYPPEELQSRPWQAITHPDDVEPTQRALDQLLAGEKDAVRLIKRYIHKDGSLVWADVSTSLRQDKAGQPLYFMTTVLDITEQREAEEALRESEKRYRSLFENMLEGYAYCQMFFEDGKPQDFVYLDVNAAFEALTGLKNVVGKRVSEAVPGIQASNPELFEIYGRVAQTGRPEKFETYLASLGIWFSISVYSPAKGYFVAVFDNVTERKQAEEALKESEERFSTAFFTSPVAQSIITQGSNEIMAINDACCRLFEYRREELIGASTAKLNLWENPADRLAALEELQRTGHLLAREATVRIKSGEIRTVVVAMEPISLRGLACLISSVFDITERKRAEAALKEYSERLEEMVAERTRELYAAQERLVRQEKLATLGQLAGGVGHELRNPLGAIKNAAFFLNMSVVEPEPEVKETLDIMNQEVAAAERIISSLLDFARPRAPAPRRVDVNAVVRAALARITLPEGIEVAAHLDDSLPAIQADPDQLGLVFGNLLRNAMQAMPGGGRLSVTTRPAPPPSPLLLGEGPGVRLRWVAVSIADTGMGISEEDLPKLFEPLFSTKAQGIGLGLAVSKLLVTAHGGSIEVQSQISQGSTFTVTLPVEQEKVK